LGSPELNHFAVAVDEEFGEVPWDLTSFLRFLVVKLTVGAQVTVDGVGVGAIHFDLGEHRELDTVRISSKGLDFSLGAFFLFFELIAGECENFEALAAELLMDLNHLFVVLVGQTSSGGDVYDKSGFLLAVEAAETFDLVSVNIFSGDVPKSGVF